MTLNGLTKNVDALRDEMHQEFEKVRQEFAQVRQETRQEFARVDQRFEGVDRELKRLDQRIVDEGATTRRHFDVVAEQMKADVKLSLDQSSAVSAQLAAAIALNAVEHEGFVRLLDNLDHRVKAIE